MSLFKSVTNKPWERKGIIGPLRPVGAFDVEAEKVALSFFLVVVGVIFSLFTISYFIRMELPDWTPLAEPSMLWINTGMLIVSSIMFQWARNILNRGGFYLASNPANSFYYLMTGLHGVHLLGGLWVWSRTSIKLLSGAEPKEVKLSVELCTTYWHFLLLVWLVLFGILANT
jgi:cytochrome c oxidase subunit 3